jgi:hypothetical protein
LNLASNNERGEIKMKNRTGKLLLIMLALLVIAVSSGCGGSGHIRGGSAFYDMHYPNPWYGYRGGLPPAQYIGPPPVVPPPDIPDLPPLEAVPLPM